MSPAVTWHDQGSSSFTNAVERSFGIKRDRKLDELIGENQRSGEIIFSKFFAVGDIRDKSRIGSENWRFRMTMSGV